MDFSVKWVGRYMGGSPRGKMARRSQIIDDQKFAKKPLAHKNTSAAPTENPCHVIM